MKCQRDEKMFTRCYVLHSLRGCSERKNDYSLIMNLIQNTTTLLKTMPEDVAALFEMKKSKPFFENEIIREEFQVLLDTIQWKENRTSIVSRRPSANNIQMELFDAKDFGVFNFDTRRMSVAEDADEVKDLNEALEAAVLKVFDEVTDEMLPLLELIAKDLLDRKRFDVLKEMIEKLLLSLESFENEAFGEKYKTRFEKMLGHLYSLENDFGEAMKHYQKVISNKNTRRGSSESDEMNFTQSLVGTLNENETVEQVFKTVNHLGTCFFQKGQYDLALELFAKCLEMTSELENPNLQNGPAQVHNNIGLCLVEQNYYQEALNHFKTSLNLKKKFGDKMGVTRTLSNMATCYQRLDLHEDSLQCCKEAYSTKLKLHGKNGINEDLAMSAYQLGDAYKRSGDNALAFKHYNRSLQIYKDIHGTDHASVAMCLYKIGLTHPNLATRMMALQEASDIAGRAIKGQTLTMRIKKDMSKLTKRRHSIHFG